MNCPSCGSATFVYDTRKSSYRVRRRRECKECGERFTTLELRKAEVDALLALSTAALKDLAEIVNRALEAMK